MTLLDFRRVRPSISQKMWRTDLAHIYFPQLSSTFLNSPQFFSTLTFLKFPQLTQTSSIFINIPQFSSTFLNFFPLSSTLVHYLQHFSTFPQLTQLCTNFVLVLRWIWKMVPKGHILEKKYLHGSLKHCISDIACVTFHYSHYISHIALVTLH